jgi:hypothetical protein
LENQEEFRIAEISVITTDFVKMGALAADMILNERSGSIKNDFQFIRRESL